MNAGWCSLDKSDHLRMMGHLALLTGNACAVTPQTESVTTSEEQGAWTLVCPLPYDLGVTIDLERPSLGASHFVSFPHPWAHRRRELTRSEEVDMEALGSQALRKSSQRGSRVLPCSSGGSGAGLMQHTAHPVCVYCPCSAELPLGRLPKGHVSCPWLRWRRLAGSLARQACCWASPEWIRSS